LNAQSFIVTPATLVLHHEAVIQLQYALCKIALRKGTVKHFYWSLQHCDDCVIQYTIILMIRDKYMGLP